jgi:hypothetical protein
MVLALFTLIYAKKLIKQREKDEPGNIFKDYYQESKKNILG